MIDWVGFPGFTVGVRSRYLSRATAAVLVGAREICRKCWTGRLPRRYLCPLGKQPLCPGEGDDFLLTSALAVTHTKQRGFPTGCSLNHVVAHVSRSLNHVAGRALFGFFVAILGPGPWR